MRGALMGAFDSIAGRYEAWYRTPAHRFIDDLEKAAVNRALPRASRGDKLLDVGCGTGHWFPVFAAAGYEIVGIDPSAAMITAARAGYGADHMLVLGGAADMPFPSSEFDAVCCITSLEFVGDRARAIEEMHRCLRPGGILLIGVLNAWSFLGMKRKLSRKPLFRDAHFYTVHELRHALAPLGAVHLETCAFSPLWDWLVPIGPQIERAGTVLLSNLGQFIVGWLKKSG
jgi:ubiquinone/menaquinone biosynthesis C-methylase UbiE